MQPDELDEALVLPLPPTLDLVSLDESLRELAEVERTQVPGGGKALLCRIIRQGHRSRTPHTEATVRRDWTIARAWLYRRLHGEAVS
jgi:hypothetical protein